MNQWFKTCPAAPTACETWLIWFPFIILCCGISKSGACCAAPLLVPAPHAVCQLHPGALSQPQLLPGAGELLCSWGLYPAVPRASSPSKALSCNLHHDLWCRLTCVICHTGTDWDKLILPSKPLQSHCRSCAKQPELALKPSKNGC